MLALQIKKERTKPNGRQKELVRYDSGRVSTRVCG